MLSVLVVPATLFALASLAQAVPPLTLTPVTNGGIISGFNIEDAGRVVAPVRLSSNGLLVATRLDDRRQTEGVLRLTGLKARDGTGLRLAEEDFVEVRLPANQVFPEVRFRLTVVDFDLQRWMKNAGRFPFHFLSVSVPEADVVHQRGWLNATPRADPFPFLLDTHVGSPEICSNWSRHWSYTAPIGCYPIPVVGLWAPAARLYVGYDFLATRLGDQSERYLATTYCWQEGKDRQFIALAFPHAGRGFQTLTYPAKGTKIEGRFRLIVSTDMPATADPNTFLQEDYFRRYADRLPRVPAMNDLGWMPGGSRLRHLPGAPRGRLSHRNSSRGQFEEAGTVQIGGWTWHRESAVTAAYRRGDRKMLEELKQDIDYLKTKVQRVTIDGEECVFWPKPIEGQWLDAWGGPPVKTLHNSNGWAAGLVLLDFYRHDRTAEYLPLIDGIYNWTRHFVWTRNEFADVPSSPFAIGGTLSAAFLPDYHFAFREDPQRAARAREAVELARKLTYRYMPIWACDNDRDDNLDAAFLWEPNSGRDWTGTACANEVHWNLDTLTQVYVNCGDPILHYYLRGSLERWHLLYKDIVTDSLNDYPRDALSEWLGLFDGTMAGRGGRASFGTGDILPLHEPVGDSLLRVTCGSRAAFACCKEGVHSHIANYRYTPDANFAFTVRSTRPDSFDVTLSCPFWDLTDRPVALVRQGKQHPLVADRDLVRSPSAPSFVYVRGIKDGDTVLVGTVAETAPVLPIDNPWTIGPPTENQLNAEGFRMVRLPSRPGSKSEACLQALPWDWKDTGSYAGLWAGTHHAWGVPFYVEPASSAGRPMALDGPVTLRLPPKHAGTAYVFFAPRSSASTLSLKTESLSVKTCGGELPACRKLEEPENGKLEACRHRASRTDSERGQDQLIHCKDCAVGWSSWPPCFQQKILMAECPIAGATSIRINLRDAYLVAVTVLTDARRHDHVAAILARGRSQWQAALAREQAVQALRSAAADLPTGRIGILPQSDAGGPVMNVLQQSRLIKKCRQLTTDDLLKPALFQARNLPVVLYLGGEEYPGTIRQKGDGAEAILNYLRSGGTIVVLSSQPLPFYYDTRAGQARVRSLTPRMGLPIGMGFERPPEGQALRILLNPKQSVITGVPRDLPFFTEGDLRLRTVHRKDVSRDISYTPLFTVRSTTGTDHGEAAALAEFTQGEFRGARLLYVWSRLLVDPEHGAKVVDQALRYAIARAAVNQ
jgi:hypothetical protein